jgi:hypothetical protein
VARHAVPSPSRPVASGVCRPSPSPRAARDDGGFDKDGLFDAGGPVEAGRGGDSRRTKNNAKGAHLLGWALLRADDDSAQRAPPYGKGVLPEGPVTPRNDDA